jgi:FkbM family methyltransferase
MLKKTILDNFVPQDFRRWLRRQKGQIRDFLFPFEPYVVTHSTGGYEFKVHIADSMAESWYTQGKSDASRPLKPELALLKKHSLKPGALVFNLGAHQGVIATLLTKIVGPTGEVVAVEATPRNAEIGKKNRDINELENLQIVNAAISDTPGETEFLPFGNGRVSEKGGELASVKVKALTVDNFAAEYGSPDVLFLDIEGFELHALRGAENVLESRPDCFVEVHTGCGLEEYGNSVHEIIAVFKNLNYSIFVASVSGNEPQTFEPLDSVSLPTNKFFMIALGNLATE